MPQQVLGCFHFRVPCLSQETLHAMGHCMYPDHCGKQPFPIHDIRNLSESALKQLAGNDS